MVELAGVPAEVPYSQTRPDDEAEASEDDSESEAIRRPIPYLERGGAREAPPRSKQLPHVGPVSTERRSDQKPRCAALQCGT